MANGNKLLRLWRKEKKLSAEKAAEILKVNLQTVYRWEWGTLTPPELRRADIARKTRGAVPSDSWV